MKASRCYRRARGGLRRWLGGPLLSAAIAGAALLQLASAPGALAESPAITLGDGAFGTIEGNPAGLLARAAERGLLPVIVGLDVPFVPEGGLTAAQAARQGQAIAGLQEQLLARLAGAQNVKRFETVPFLALTATPAELQRLLADPAVTSIAEDVAVPPALNQSTKVIAANRAWQRGFRGNDWVVAVLDTGVQRNHSAFQGKIVSEACYSSTVAGQSTSVCPRGVASSVRAGAGANCPAGVAGCDHGTHVAGIAVGNHGNRPGVANGASLIPMQVFSRFDSAAFCGSLPTPCALTYTSDQIRGLERVLQQARSRKIASANMSLGGGTFFANCDSDARSAVIDNLRSRGIATVIASGNNGFNGATGAPACISSAIAVGSTTKSDEVSSFSNHAYFVDLMAPGSAISAPVLRNRVGVKSGTSMAAPHVAGAWALLMQARPSSTVQEVARALVCTGQEVARLNITKPRINVNAAISFLRRAANSRRQSWDFTTAAQFRQWRKDLGNWRHAGELLRAVGRDSGQWSIATSPLCTGNITVDARLRRVDPDTSGFHWNSGIFLHATASEGVNVSGLWFAVNKADGGSSVIWRLQGRNYQTGVGGTSVLLCSQAFGTLKIGGFNRLRVISRDGLHRMLINGTEVCRATDRSFEAGFLSVAMATPSTDGRQHRFDVDSVVASPLAGGTALELATPTDLPTAPLEIPAGVSPLGVAVGATTPAVPTH